MTITVITFESSPTSDKMEKVFKEHLKTNNNGFCVVKNYDTNFLSYLDIGGLVGPVTFDRAWIWTIQIQRDRKNRYLNQINQKWLNKSDFVDWIIESYPDSFEWLLFNPEWLA